MVFPSVSITMIGRFEERNVEDTSTEVPLLARGTPEKKRRIIGARVRVSGRINKYAMHMGAFLHPMRVLDRYASHNVFLFYLRCLFLEISKELP